MMETTFAVIRPTGLIEFHTGEPDLGTLQAAVGGDLERILPRDGTLRPMRGLTILANEDPYREPDLTTRAAREAVALNLIASSLMNVRLVGPVIVSGPPVRGDMAPLPEEAEGFLRAVAERTAEVTP